MPNGLYIDGETGLIAGVVAEGNSGLYDVTVTATDPEGDATSVDLVLSVAATTPVYKTITVIVDDFSDRVFDYDNVSLFDWGSFNTARVFGTVDENTSQYSLDHWANITDPKEGFHQVFSSDYMTDDYSVKWIGSDTGVDSAGNAYEYGDFLFLDRQQTSATEVANHGDWVLDAYFSELADSSNNEVICIDVDTLNGTDSHFSQLFESTTSYWDPSQNSTVLENIVQNWISTQSYSEDYYLTCMSASIAGAPTTSENLPTFNFLGSQYAPIVQATPNVSQGDYDWGSNYASVINVGAWNQAANGESLVSSTNTIDTIDIVANGLVSHLVWGENFGTSFATPRVAAALTNLTESWIDYWVANPVPDSESDSGTAAQSFEKYVASLVYGVSTDVSVDLLVDGATVGSNVLVPLLSSDALDGDPGETTVGFASNGISGLVISGETINSAVDSSGLLVGGELTENQAVYATGEYEDANLSNNTTPNMSYQWFKVADDGFETNIGGATASTYTVTSDDVGYVLGYRMSFVDTDGFAETAYAISSAAVASLVVDDVGPFGLSGNIHDGAFDVPLDWLLSFDLSEQSFLGTSEVTFVADDADFSFFLAAEDVILSSNGWVATFDLSNNLHADTHYAVNAPSGVLVDAAGNDSLPLFIFDFTTGQSVVSVPGDVYLVKGDVNGFNADDVIIAGPESVTVFAGAGNDHVTGSTQGDSLRGWTGNDTLIAGGGADYLEGGAGDDTIKLTVDGQWHQGYMAMNASSPSAIGTHHIVALGGLNKFLDVTDGGLGKDVLQLTSGADAFFLDDVMSEYYTSVNTQGGSIDRIVAMEEITAGNGDDLIDLTSATLMLSDDIVVQAGMGDDIIWAAAGDDELFGGDGNDVLFGGVGNDIMAGGQGADIFQFTATCGLDRIDDFDIQQGDKLEFHYRQGKSISEDDVSIVGGIISWVTHDKLDNSSAELVVSIDLRATYQGSDYSDLAANIQFYEIA